MLILHMSVTRESKGETAISNNSKMTPTVESKRYISRGHKELFYRIKNSGTYLKKIFLFILKLLLSL